VAEKPSRRGAAVIRYDGKRGVVWRIKYEDASGRQVKETLGSERDGWTREKARAELEERLVDVRREGLLGATRLTLDAFAREWLTTYPETKGLKRSTRQGYESIVERHLVPAFGHLRLSDLGSGHVERYVATALAGGLSARTVNSHLNVLHLICRSARKRKLLRSNPVEDVDRPRPPRRRWTILSPVEVARTERAFAQLAAEVEGDDVAAEEERAFLEQARVVFLVVVTLGLRRGELLGLRWRNVLLADPHGAALRVEETWVRDRPDTPKSEASERTIALGSRLADELFQHRARTRFAGNDEFVFCHPLSGSVLDRWRYADRLRAALAKAKVEKPLRPFHDGRHTALTNAAIAGNAPASIQAQAGHADFSTTQLYIDLAGVSFREEAQAAEDRLLGAERPADE
jgi:integrase